MESCTFTKLCVHLSEVLLEGSKDIFCSQEKGQPAIMGRGGSLISGAVGLQVSSWSRGMAFGLVTILWSAYLGKRCFGEWERRLRLMILGEQCHLGTCSI